MSLSVNLFLNLYNDIRTTEFLSGATTIPIEFLNGYARAATYGIEAWGKAQVPPWWRLDVGSAATTLHKNFHVATAASTFARAIRSATIPLAGLRAAPTWT